MVRVCALAVMAACLAVARPADAQSAPLAPSAAGGRTATALRLDGDLDDAFWTRAEPVSAFVQREPAEGGPPSMRTEARVAFDEVALYIRVRANDPDQQRITGFLTRRDANSNSDWVHVLV